MTGAKSVLIQDKTTVQFQQDLGVDRDRYYEELVPQRTIYMYHRFLMQLISAITGIFTEIVNKCMEVFLS